MENFEESGSFEKDQFEMMFRWGRQWVSIVVVPVKDELNTQYFVVKMDGLVVILRLNQFNEWEELKEGVTELAKHLGLAIEEYYAICI